MFGDLRETRGKSLYCRNLIITVTRSFESDDRALAALGSWNAEILQSRWKEVVEQVDGVLRGAIEGLGSQCPERLRQAISYSLLAPGKRLRPLLCVFACQAAGGTAQQALANAAALEMIHCYSLIHDDLPAMDDDHLRRGRPTCHIQFDEATAILAGDALQPLAFETILKSTLSAPQLLESSLVLARAAGSQGMVAGQMDDLLAESLDPSQMPIEDQKEWLSSIHRRKTGAMIEASVLLGAIAAGATSTGATSTGAKSIAVPSNYRSALATYGRGIGIAFQIVDDLLDVESTSEKTGKATGKDAARGKLTFPGIYGIIESRAMAVRWVEDALAALEPFDERAEGLRQVAKYILERHS
jgi:geranylgeranyl diphosphate synthase type II